MFPIVLLALALRWIFFVGFGVNADDGIYAGMSKEFMRRGRTQREERAILRILA